MTRHRSGPIDPDTPVVRFVGKFCTSCARAGIVLQLTNHNRVQGSANLTCKPCAAAAVAAKVAQQRADGTYKPQVRGPRSATQRRKPQPPPVDLTRAHLHSLLDRVLNHPSQLADEAFDSMLLNQRIRALIRFT